MVIIDAWMQHPSAEFLADPMFDPLRRWARGHLAGDGVPTEATVAAMDTAGVRTGMLCAWRGPRGPLISNDAVAAIIARYPGRFAGVAAVDLVIWPVRWTPCGSCGAACMILASGRCGWCRGCGTCRPATAVTTRCTPSASSSLTG